VGRPWGLLPVAVEQPGLQGEGGGGLQTGCLLALALALAQQATPTQLAPPALPLSARSMREDPQPHKPMDEKTFAGDNFVRKSGDYEAWQALNLHSLVASAKGQDIHMQVGAGARRGACPCVPARRPAPPHQQRFLPGLAHRPWAAPAPCPPHRVP
jgi:hypothetical protein